MNKTIVKTPTFNFQHRPLRKAASLDDRTLLEASLAGQYGEVEDGAMEDALIRAASHGNTECVATLLQHAADPDARDMDGDTPLMVAVANGHTGEFRQWDGE